jgi:hypothetical protein
MAALVSEVTRLTVADTRAFTQRKLERKRLPSSSDAKRKVIRQDTSWSFRSPAAKTGTACVDLDSLHAY